jgi:isopentenyl diphosphate isomerase/L-lactate dehydrogenase-like FMN-dependent dehydrogenase
MIACGKEVLMRLDPSSLYDYEARAQQVLPHDYWDFIAGGSKDELTTRRNRSAFDAMSLRPRFLRDVTERQLATTVLGTTISFPVMVSPAGGHKLVHPEGECATARGAGMSQTLMMLSTSSHCSLEDVAKVATGPLWFQLYHRGDDATKMLVQRAEYAGYKAIVLTVDTPLPAPKERDIRNRYVNPFPLANFSAMPEYLLAMRGTDEATNWQPAHVLALT